MKLSMVMYTYMFLVTLLQKRHVINLKIPIPKGVAVHSNDILKYLCPIKHTYNKRALPGSSVLPKSM